MFGKAGIFLPFSVSLNLENLPFLSFQSSNRFKINDLKSALSKYLPYTFCTDKFCTDRF